MKNPTLERAETCRFLPFDAILDEGHAGRLMTRRPAFRRTLLMGLSG